MKREIQTRNQIKYIANKLQKQLISKGFIIQRVESVSTNSIYLRVDNGLCGTIRIGDHIGKSKYCFSYNLYPDSLKITDTQKCYKFSETNNVVEKIVEVRQGNINKLGVILYYQKQQERWDAPKSIFAKRARVYFKRFY